MLHHLVLDLDDLLLIDILIRRHLSFGDATFEAALGICILETGLLGCPFDQVLPIRGLCLSIDGQDLDALLAVKLINWWLPFLGGYACLRQVIYRCFGQKCRIITQLSDCDLICVPCQMQELVRLLIKSVWICIRCSSAGMILHVLGYADVVRIRALTIDSIDGSLTPIHSLGAL